MTRHRWLSLAVGAGAAVCVISAGASALASTHSEHGNYRGPARSAVRAATTTHGTNYNGPARGPAKGAVTHGSNLPASGRN